MMELYIHVMLVLIPIIVIKRLIKYYRRSINFSIIEIDMQNANNIDIPIVSNQTNEKKGERKTPVKKNRFKDINFCKGYNNNNYFFVRSRVVFYLINVYMFFRKKNHDISIFSTSRVLKTVRVFLNAVCNKFFIPLNHKKIANVIVKNIIFN